MQKIKNYKNFLLTYITYKKYSRKCFKQKENYYNQIYIKSSEITTMIVNMKSAQMYFLCKPNVLKILRFLNSFLEREEDREKETEKHRWEKH